MTTTNSDGVQRHGCVCGVCDTRDARPAMHTHATTQAAAQCSQPGCRGEALKMLADHE